MEELIRVSHRHAGGAAAARHAVLSMLLLGCVLISSCSVVGTVYGQLDRIIVMQADRWLALDRAQRAQLRADVGASLERHRSEELPAWIALLRRLAEQVEGKPEPEELLLTIEQARELVQRSTRLLLRPFAEALSRLQPEQIRHLEGEMKEDNAEYAEEFLDPSPIRRAASKVERTRQAIERWSGQLDATQVARVETLVAAIPDGAEAWRDYRHAWQANLLGRLQAGDDAPALEQLLHDWWIGDTGLDPAYAAQLARNRTIIAHGLADLIASFAPAQRKRAAGRLRDVAEELEAVPGPAGPRSEFSGHGPA